MSATLSLTSFLDNRRLFPEQPPVLSIPARQHPLTIHFSRRTKPDYVDEAFQKVLKIHKRLPEGGILVFLTGQREIEHVVAKLTALGKKPIQKQIPSSKRNRKQEKTMRISEKQGKPNLSSYVSATQMHFISADVEIDDIDFGVDRITDCAGIDNQDVQIEDYDSDDLDGEVDELDKELGIEMDGGKMDGMLKYELKSAQY
jgi:ATP-dependent RNA helicase DHX37/DHR1